MHVDLCSVSVNGYWQPWQAWQPCDVSCGGGSQFRVRVCVEPLHGGDTCPGSNRDTQSCNAHPCPGWFLFVVLQFVNEEILIQRRSPR